MDKGEILLEIKRIASASDGRAPGSQKFSTETGVKKSDWYPKLWLRWSDAINEAGCMPNVFNSSFDDIFLIEKYINLIRELGKFPIEGELRNKQNSDKSFPSHGAFRSFGVKQERIQKILRYCKGKSDFDDIASICSTIVKTAREDKNTANSDSSTNVGYVYLLRHGTRNEYKIGRTNNPVRREGEIRLELPEQIQPICYIKTDDPAGIESYWHSRFSSKRKNGEWFSLKEEDVRAFKRWRNIF